MENCKIDLKQFANRINGKQYSYSIFSDEEIQFAVDNGIVIVTGESDDLIEFEGAIDGERDCYEGGKFWINRYGLTNDTWNARCIEAVWDGPGAGAAWSYVTDIPHKTFDVYEDDEIYCKGIVFFLSDLPVKSNGEKSGDELPVDDDSPCNECYCKDTCDGWEAMFCCTLCQYEGRDFCDECDPMDI